MKRFDFISLNEEEKTGYTAQKYTGHHKKQFNSLFRFVAMDQFYLETCCRDWRFVKLTSATIEHDET